MNENSLSALFIAISISFILISQASHFPKIITFILSLTGSFSSIQNRTVLSCLIELIDFRLSINLNAFNPQPLSIHFIQEWLTSIHLILLFRFNYSSLPNKHAHDVLRRRKNELKLKNTRLLGLDYLFLKQMGNISGWNWLIFTEMDKWFASCRTHMFVSDLHLWINYWICFSRLNSFIFWFNCFHGLPGIHHAHGAFAP